MAAPLVRFDAVCVAFGDQRVLIDADFLIEPNERVCLIGRNGAGKSTTLKLLAELQTAEQVVETAVERWAELEELAASAAQREP